MALSLPPRTAELVTHGNTLMADFQQQGVTLHHLVFQQKEVAAKIENMIMKFENHEVMSRTQETLAILKDVEEGYKNIKENIDRIDAKEKEMSGIIQKILERQHQGNAESANVRAEIVEVQRILSSNQEQLAATQSELNRMNGELQQLHKNIADAERKVKRKKKKRTWWVIGTILTAGVLGIGAHAAYKSVAAAKKDVAFRQQMLQNTQNNFNNLQATFNTNQANKVRLEGEQATRQHELDTIQQILIRLQPAQQDTIKYRQYLLDLSDAFNQVNSYVQNLHSKLDDVSQIQSSGFVPDEILITSVNISCENLATTWNAAKNKEAIQTAINLQDPNNVDFTLRAIKDKY